MSRSSIRRGVIANESFSTNADEKFTLVPKSQEVRTKIEQALHKHFLFKALDKVSLSAVIDSMNRRLMAPGEYIIREGEIGDVFYVIEHGKVDVIVAGHKIGNIEGPAAFGELGLMYNSPRAASILCCEYGVLWTIERLGFRKVLAAESEKKLRRRIKFLRKVPLLKSLQMSQITRIAETLQSVSYADGEHVVVEGEEGTKFYIVEEGCVEVSQTKEKQKVVLAKLYSGNFFGERALLKNEPRDATCSAAGKNGPNSNRKNQEISNEKNNSVNDQIDDTNVEVTSHGVIGIGTFSRSKLISHDASGKIYLLKSFQKSYIEKTHQIQNIFSEKHCLQKLNHPCILHLFGTWQNKDFLYMFLEFVPGGDLWTVLYDSDVLPFTRFGGLKENISRNYVSLVLLAIQHIHKSFYIFRNLKPENILITRSGYIKVSDFGFAKYVTDDEKTMTLCGSPEYLAPEIVLAKGHNRAVDYWSLGIFLYELLFGRTPFANNDESKIFLQIVHSERCLVFPDGSSPDSKDLMDKLLRHTHTLRLGMHIGGCEDILHHRWFGGIDWSKLQGGKYEPPFLPNVQNNLDRSNFDEFEEDEEIVLYTGKQDCFEGF
eukprot:GSMAST32.ASY1.ANO1.485.1 assembled CDS